MGLSRSASSFHRDLRMANPDDDLEQSNAVGNRVGISRVGLAGVFVLAENCERMKAAICHFSFDIFQLVI